MLCYIVQLSFKVKSQLYSGSMDVNRGSEIYTVELGDKRVKLKKEQLTTNVLAKIFHIFLDTSILISDDGYAVTANSKGFFEDLDMDMPGNFL